MSDHLQIDDDPRFQLREWRAERVGWVLIAVLVVAMLAGLFGNGPLSYTTSSAGGLTADYQRFARRGAETALEVTVAPKAVTGSELRLWLPADYLSAFDVRQVIPQPHTQQAADGGVVFVFTAAEGDPFRAEFQLVADAFGGHRADLRLLGGPAVPVQHFVFP